MTEKRPADSLIDEKSLEHILPTSHLAAGSSNEAEDAPRKFVNIKSPKQTTSASEESPSTEECQNASKKLHEETKTDLTSIKINSGQTDQNDIDHSQKDKKDRNQTELAEILSKQLKTIKENTSNQCPQDNNKIDITKPIKGDHQEPKGINGIFQYGAGNGPSLLFGNPGQLFGNSTPMTGTNISLFGNSTGKRKSILLGKGVDSIFNFASQLPPVDRASQDGNDAQEKESNSQENEDGGDEQVQAAIPNKVTGPVNYQYPQNSQLLFTGAVRKFKKQGVAEPIEDVEVCLVSSTSNQKLVVVRTPGTKQNICYGFIVKGKSSVCSFGINPCNLQVTVGVLTDKIIKPTVYKLQMEKQTDVRQFKQLFSQSKEDN